MKFRVFSNLDYQINSASTIILNIHAIRNSAQTVLQESLELDPFIPIEEISSSPSENRYIRLESNELDSLKIAYWALIDLKCKLIPKEELFQSPIVKLEQAIIPYLFPSRYCQSDRLMRLANDKFGKIDHPYEKVRAVTDWIYHNVEYLSGSTNSQTSAFDTVTQRVGVCRDFAHLGIALCRALSIPSRYFGGYSFNLNPPDFHACFEAYLGGQWVIFDATKLVPLNGLVRVSTGRDAADAAVATFFGDVFLIAQTVNSFLAEDNFSPLYFQDLQEQGLSID
jgi:transglutaminase-like putative cysteine protease